MNFRSSPSFLVEGALFSQVKDWNCFLLFHHENVLLNLGISPEMERWYGDKSLALNWKLDFKSLEIQAMTNKLSVTAYFVWGEIFQVIKYKCEPKSIGAKSQRRGFWCQGWGCTPGKKEHKMTGASEICASSKEGWETSIFKRETVDIWEKKKGGKCG